MASILNPWASVRAPIAIWLLVGLDACASGDGPGDRTEVLVPEPVASTPAPAARVGPPPPPPPRDRRVPRVMGVTWSPDGRTLVAPLAEEGIDVWDLLTGTTHRTTGSHLATAAWRRDGHLLIGDAWLNGKGGILDDTRGTTAVIDSEDVEGVSFDPDATAVFGTGRMVGVWDAATGAPRRVFWRTRREEVCFETAGGGDWSPDGRLVAAAVGRWSAQMVFPGRVTIWDAATGTVLRNLPMPTPAAQVRFSPDSRTLAVSDVGDAVSLWSPRSGRRLRTVRIPDNGNQIAWSPDGQKLAVAPFDAYVAVWDVRSGAVVRIPSEGHAWVRGASFSPDGRVLAFAMEERGIRLHRLADGAGLTLSGGRADPAALSALLAGPAEQASRPQEAAQ